MDEELSNKIEQESKLLSDEDPRERLNGILRLTNIALQLPMKERETIVARLAKLADDNEPFVRWNIAHALAKIGHASGMKVIADKLANDEHMVVRYKAALALDMIGDESAIPVLEKMASDT